MNPTIFSEALHQEIEQTEYGSPTELYEPIRYIMNLGGKRMRPLFTLMAAYLFSDDWRKALKPALAVEVFHNFTLVHDDIMDRAPLRRGQPTVHAKWNSNIAILSGDVMLVSSYKLLLEVEEPYLKKVLTRFTCTTAEVCEGQQLDMNFETRWDVREEEYLDMIKRKTSVLLGFALELGGIIAGADSSATDRLRDGGINIGLGFQLKDDLLDVYGDPTKFGKQIGGDIVANKKTFLLIEALQQATGPQKEELLSWLRCTEFDKQEKIHAVTRIYDEMGIRDLTEQRINDCFTRGFATIEQIEADPTRKNLLLSFAEQLIGRES